MVPSKDTTVLNEVRKGSTLIGHVLLQCAYHTTASRYTIYFVSHILTLQLGKALHMSLT